MPQDLTLLPLAASICLITALIQAWIMTANRYFDVPIIQKIFPNCRDLVRSHVDYLIMTAIIFSLYMVLVQLKIELPIAIIYLIFIGALYNPFGFILQAIKPGIVDNGGWFIKAGTVVGFMPLSIGLFWAAFTVLFKVIG